MATGFESIVLLIGAATVLGIGAQRTGQPKIIAYILAGLVLGPVGLDLVETGEMLDLFSELGLVFLLFLIGLEIDIDEVRDILRETVGIAIVQMSLTFAVGLGLAVLTGFSGLSAAIVGASLTFSSTALVVKVLTERDEATTLPGRLDVGILLVQDVAVVVVLALLTVEFSSLAQAALKLAEVLFMIAVVGALSVLSSRYFFSEVLREISENRLAFFTHGIAWAFVFITMADALGLSLEIGAFLAGIGLGQIPYSSELQETVRPLTDLFMAVFFINFGIGITGNSLQQYMLPAIATSAVLIATKFAVLFATIDRFKFTPGTSFKASVNMSQISEFGLILIGLAVAEGYTEPAASGYISMVAIMTMGSSAYLIRYRDRLEKGFKPLLKLIDSEEKTDLEVQRLKDHAVIIGYNRMAEEVCRKLSEEYEIIVVDKDSENTERLGESDYRYLYGDFGHEELRKGASLDKAEFILSLSDQRDTNTEVLREKRDDAVAILEADSFEDATELYDLGADYVILENVLAADRIAEYIELYLEDRELFKEEIGSELDKIRGEDQSQS